MTSMPQLQELAIDPVSLGIGAAVGAAIVGIAFLLRSSSLSRQNAVLQAKLDSERAALEDSFKVLAQGVLQSNTENFLTLAQERLKAANADSAHSLDKKSLEIQKMVEPVQQHLQRMSSMVEQLQATDKTIRDDLFKLHNETSKLNKVLINPSAQGRWGEYMLETILHKADLIKGVHYTTQEQLADGRRPDTIVTLHDGYKIAIDSKAPINEFISLLDQNLSDEEALNVHQSMAKTVRGHVKALGARAYQDNITGADFVILFLPSESFFSAVLRNDPSIADYATENNVVIASPTLIMSLLRVVRMSWRQVDMAKNAQEIARLGADLHKRFSKFLEHFAKISKGLNTAISSYNDAVGSMDRSVLPAARKFQKLHSINENAALPEVAILENTPRQLISPVDTEESVDFEADNSDKVGHG